MGSEVAPLFILSLNHAIGFTCNSNGVPALKKGSPPLESPLGNDLPLSSQIAKVHGRE